MATQQDTTEMTIVLAGRSGAGKTTLMKKLLGKYDETASNPLADTTTLKKETIKRNGVNIHVIDTIGLMKIKTRELKRISADITKNADLLVYCIALNPGKRFDDAPIIKCLTQAFTERIWRHCILVFTMSNVLLGSLKEKDQSTAAIRYKEYIKRYAVEFEKCLNGMKINQKVTTTLHMEHQHPENTILATPAGSKPQDLAELQYKLVADNFDPSTATWETVLVALILKKGTQKCAEGLLKYQYGKMLAKKILSITGGVGATAGGVIGGVALGAIVGILLGPGGVVAGGVFGGIAGGAAAVAAAGGVVGGLTIAGNELREQQKNEKEMEKLKQDQEGICHEFVEPKGPAEPGQESTSEADNP